MTPSLRPIKLSEVTKLEEQGFRRLAGCDAAKANGDFFQVMESQEPDGTRRIAILCPSFLRGPLGFKVEGSISY
jgi:hypothetical protein